MRTARGFTLVEILTVVVLLGILAAIVVPQISRSNESAKQSALATDLQLLRRFIMVYTAHHLEVAPGYPDGNTSASPTELTFIEQATMSSNNAGETAAVGTAGFERGPYVLKIPANPINDKDTVKMLGNDEDFPVDADDSHGWIYKAATGQIRSDTTGTDSNGTRYYDY
jgi:prepilin-type N-terminal cleavage/methylation domain-containing protein